MPNVPNESDECPCQTDCECNPYNKQTFCCCDACEECAVCGCTDEKACNYNDNADLNGPECDVCKFGGCTDSCDNCYDSEAECGDPDECCGPNPDCDPPPPPYNYYGQWGAQT